MRLAQVYTGSERRLSQGKAMGVFPLRHYRGHAPCCRRDVWGRMELCILECLAVLFKRFPYCYIKYDSLPHSVFHLINNIFTVLCLSLPIIRLQICRRYKLSDPLSMTGLHSRTPFGQPSVTSVSFLKQHNYVCC